jgi:Tyrosyl-DNA phosphodiesterase
VWWQDFPYATPAAKTQCGTDFGAVLTDYLQCTLAAQVTPAIGRDKLRGDVLGSSTAAAASLTQLIQTVQTVDFTAARVALVPSVSGVHAVDVREKYGQCRVEALLRQELGYAASSSSNVNGSSSSTTDSGSSNAKKNSSSSSHITHTKSISSSSSSSISKLAYSRSSSSSSGAATAVQNLLPHMSMAAVGSPLPMADALCSVWTWNKDLLGNQTGPVAYNNSKLIAQSSSLSKAHTHNADWMQHFYSRFMPDSALRYANGLQRSDQWASHLEDLQEAVLLSDATISRAATRFVAIIIRLHDDIYIYVYIYIASAAV